MAVTKGYGAKAYYGAADPAATEFADVVSIEPNSVEVEEIDISTMQSTDQWREFCASWKVGGELSVTMHFEKVNTTALYALIGVDDQWFLYEFADGSKFGFQGFIKGYTDAVPIDDKIETTLTMRIDGKPVYTAAA